MERDFVLAAILSENGMPQCETREEEVEWYKKLASYVTDNTLPAPIAMAIAMDDYMKEHFPATNLKWSNGDEIDDED